jgi:hypothetical protein
MCQEENWPRSHYLARKEALGTEKCCRCRTWTMNTEPALPYTPGQAGYICKKTDNDAYCAKMCLYEQGRHIMLASAARCVMADSGKADRDDIPTHIATSKMTVGYRLVTVGTTPSSFDCSYFAPNLHSSSTRPGCAPHPAEVFDYPRLKISFGLYENNCA